VPLRRRSPRSRRRRIFTNPNPAAELKRLFPAAAAFSRAAGTAALQGVCGGPESQPAAQSDRRRPSGQPISCRRGARLPRAIHMLVGMDMTGRAHPGWLSLQLGSRNGYFSVEPPEIRRAVQGEDRARPVQDRRRRGLRVARVRSHRQARRARIRDSSRIVAKQLLPPRLPSSGRAETWGDILSARKRAIWLLSSASGICARQLLPQRASGSSWSRSSPPSFTWGSSRAACVGRDLSRWRT